MTALQVDAIPAPGRVAAALGTARVLREALPWTVRWSGRTVVVKYGGSALADDAEATFAADVALLHALGVRVVVVHGGGPQISAMAGRLGLLPRFVDGLRVTDAAMLDVVRMVLLGQVNPQLVGALVAAGARAVGIAGTDGALLTADQADPRLGLVGDVTQVDAGLVEALLDRGAVPVIAPLARDAAGQELNVNADTAAAAVAVGLRADKLVCMTDVAGLYRDFGVPGVEPTLLSHVGVGRLRALLAEGALADGMRPKVAAAVAALDGGVPRAHLLDGRVEHALLLEMLTDTGVGTMVTPDEEVPT